jgi:predicted dehydrogenase
MSHKLVRAAVVGVGSLGQHHARVYSELEGVELVGVFDADEKAARQVAKKCRTRVFESLDEVCRDADAASVAVPTDRHRDIAGGLLEAGLHLLVEKPIAATTAEAEELVALARRHGVILQVGHIERFNPVLSALEDRSHPPRFIEAHRLAPYPPPRDGLPPRGTEVSVLLDLMIHDLEILLHLVGSEVTHINAVGVPVLSPTEDIANVRLRFANGCIANVTASRISPEKLRKIRVFRDDAYISLDYMRQEGELYTRSNGTIQRDKVPVEKREPLAAELEAFIGCVARRDEPVVSGEQAARALGLAVDIVRQIQEGPS